MKPSLFQTFQGIKSTAVYFLFWLVYFLLFRAVFFIYHLPESRSLDPALLLGSFYHGIKMDVSFACYITMLILLLLCLPIKFKPATVNRILVLYTLSFLSLVAILYVVDLELFNEWGFRIDTSVLTYLNTPKELAASVSSSPYALLITSIIVTILVTYRIYKTLVHPRFVILSKPAPIQCILYVILAGALIIPIRGGFQLAPMNQSSVFFSKNDFANQAAINVPWNFFWSLSKQLYSNENPYSYVPMDQGDSLMNILYKKSLNTPFLLSTKRPNVILILWESFSAQAVSVLGGNSSDVVPEFEALIPEGILFTNFYANGERSDKGIVAVLSGYPALPKRSIVKIPAKSLKLPVISTHFNRNGYYTGYFHGGELEFANIRSYLLGAEFNTIIGKNSFRKSEMNSKWGAHDHLVLNRAFIDISKQPQPFFNMIFTLSSHEPFEIPTPPRFPGNDLENLYKSSLNYTDQSIATFIKNAKETDWYNNTLIIILADHGHRLLDESPRYHKGRYHIPMLWLGGALAVRDTIMTKSFSQTDIAQTLLNQLSMESSEFKWSRDMFNPMSHPGAFYVYNDGIGFVNNGEQFVFDHSSNSVLIESGPVNELTISLAKAYLQMSYQDYLDK